MRRRLAAANFHGEPKFLVQRGAFKTRDTGGTDPRRDALLRVP
jgi:hypothetical protein